MLKKVGFGLMLMLAISFSLDLLPEKFERPWNYEYTWPGNSSVVDHSGVPPLSPGWNAYVLQESMDSLGLDEVEYPYSEYEKIKDAESSYSKTKEVYGQMDEFTNYGLLPYFFDIEDVCREVGAENCSCHVSPGNVLECNTGIPRFARQAVAIRWLSADYSNAWKDAMDNALDALEEKNGETNDALLKLQQDYYAAAETGICERDVSGFEACENVAFFFMEIENGWKGNFEKAKEISDNDMEAVSDDVPLVEVGEAINIIGDENGGLLGEIGKFDGGLVGYVEKTLRTHNALLEEADYTIEKANEAKGNADDAELWRIRAAPSFGEIIGDETAAVSEKNIESAGLLDAAVGNRSAAYFEMIYQNQGYLRNAIAYLSNAKALADESIRIGDGAFSDAEAIVSDYDAKAEGWILKVKEKFSNGVWPEKAAALYAQANEDLENGWNSGVLGAKFEYYASAIKNAKDAYAVSAESELDTNWSAIASCNEAKDVLARAKADDVDVFVEDGMLSVLMESGNASQLIVGCRRIIDSVVESSKYEYSELDGMRADAWDLIGLCGADCDDLKNKVVGAERDVVYMDNIVYPEAIGSLSKLATLYSEMISDAKESIGQQVSRYLVVRKGIFAEGAVLDGSSEARLEISVANPIEYPVENVQVDIGSAVEFSAEDVVNGGANVLGAAYLDGMLRLYVRRINASSEQTFVFEKNSSLLRTESNERSAIGMEDGSAYVRETRDVSSDAAINGFYVDENWGMLKVDGLPASIENGFVRVWLEEGVHDFEANYIVWNAYSASVVTNTSSVVGERTYQKYRVEVLPAMDMDYVEVFAPAPQSEFVKDVNAITMSGEKVEFADASDGVVVKVYGLKEGTPARFEISYYVDNSTQYVVGKIAELEGMNLSANAQAIVDDAKDAMLANDSALAAQKIREAYGQIKIDERESAKLAAEYDEYYSLIKTELGKIEKAVENGSSSWLLENLDARKDYLAGLLDSIDGKPLNEQVQLLRAYDGKWLGAQLRIFKKNASLEINKAYVEYVNGGSQDDGIALSFVGVRNAYKKFDASGAVGDAVNVANALEEVSAKLAGIMAKKAEENAAIAASANALVEGFVDLLDAYSEEYDGAQGTRFESFFKIKPDDAGKTLKQLEVDLKKGNASAVSKTYGKLIGINASIRETLAYLEGAAERNIAHVKEAVAVVSGRISEKDAKRVAALSAEAGGYFADAQYVKALKANDEIVKLVSNVGSGGNYDLVLWLSAVFVIGVVGVYYFKERKEKPKKIFKKLEKAV